LTTWYCILSAELTKTQVCPGKYGKFCHEMEYFSLFICSGKPTSTLVYSKVSEIKPVEWKKTGHLTNNINLFK